LKEKRLILCQKIRFWDRLRGECAYNRIDYIKMQKKGDYFSTEKQRKYKIRNYNVALNLFLKDGYSNTYIQTIAEGIGISKGNLMFHY